MPKQFSFIFVYLSLVGCATDAGHKIPPPISSAPPSAEKTVGSLDRNIRSLEAALKTTYSRADRINILIDSLRFD